MYDPEVRRIELIGAVIEDERQLDGSRHVEVVSDTAEAEAALRIVISRDGLVEEAELSLSIGGRHTVIEFDLEAELAPPDAGDDGLDDGLEGALDIRLRGSAGEAALRQRDDGEIDLRVSLFEDPGAGR